MLSRTTHSIKELAAYLSQDPIYKPNADCDPTLFGGEDARPIDGCECPACERYRGPRRDGVNPTLRIALKAIGHRSALLILLDAFTSTGDPSMHCRYMVALRWAQRQIREGRKLTPSMMDKVIDALNRNGRPR